MVNMITPEIREVIRQVFKKNGVLNLLSVSDWNVGIPSLSLKTG